LLDLAQQLATEYGTEPQTLINAARDHATTDSDFAINIGIAALRGLDAGYGYNEPRPVDVVAAYEAVRHAADAAGKSADVGVVLQALFGQPKDIGLVWSVLSRLPHINHKHQDSP
jgi:hypothetical protein